MCRIFLRNLHQLPPKATAFTSCLVQAQVSTVSET